MKNLHTLCGLPIKKYRPPLLPKSFWMKISFVFISLFFAGLQLTMAHDGFGQEVNETVQLHAQDEILTKIFRIIEDQTSLHFAYNPELVGKYSATISTESMSVEEVLREVLKDTPLQYKIVKDKVLVTGTLSARLPQREALRKIPILTRDHLLKIHPLNITGTVTDKNDNPLVGVNILVKGTSKGTTTDFEGRFSLSDVDEQAVLVISYIGYRSQEVPLSGRTDLTIVLEEDIQTLDEVVVVGYGTVKRSDLTGAVASVSSKDLQASVAKSVSNALQGRVAGVSVTNLGGQPGSGMNINIRGLSTLGSNTPLYVIDGVYGDINLVDPSDIESLEVLKDASAAAIYGSRAANGVVLITTKSGGKNRPVQIDANVYTGIQSITKRLDVLNAQEWKNIMRETGYLPQEAADFQGEGTHWQDEIFRVAPVTKANIGISGGGENSTYSLSAGYMNQQGALIESGYETVNLRLKNTFDFFNNHLRLGNTLMLNSSDKQINNMTITDALRQNPLLPVMDPDQLGGYAGVASWMKNMDNPVGASKLYENNRRGTDLLINVFAEVNLGLEGLKYKINSGFNKNDAHNRNYNPPYDFGSGVIQSYLGESASFNNQWLLEHTLHYDRNLEKHNISALLGYSAQKYSGRGFSASRKDIPFGTDALDAASPAEQLTSGSLNENALTSRFARLIYSYDSRYLFTASVRNDGSSRFSDGHRYGTFPSVAVGWNIMNEEFFNANNTIDELKLRLSYGVLGNQEIGNYSTQNTTSTGLNYLQGGEYWIGSITGTSWVSPRDLTWEETKTSNIGMDISLLGNKWSLSADYYIKETSGVLLSIGMPPSTGLSGNPTMNAGVVENKGLELMLNHQNRVGQIDYSVGFNATTIKNKIKDITVGTTQEFAGFNPHGEGTVTWAKLGDPIGAFYLIKTDGIFQNEAEIQAHTSPDGELLQPNAKPGDIRFIDYNGDGQITDDDRQYAGSPFPKLSYGFRGNIEYNGFDLGIFFDGLYGNKIYNYTRARMLSMNEITNFGKDALNAWTPENTNTDIPRFTQEDQNLNRRRVSDRWLEDGSFFRLKTIELGYTFGSRLLERAQLNHVRLFVAGENIFVATKYSGYTPDLGQYDGQNGQGEGTLSRGTDVGRFPQARTLMIGLQANF